MDYSPIFASTQLYEMGVLGKVLLVSGVVVGSSLLAVGLYYLMEKSISWNSSVKRYDDKRKELSDKIEPKNKDIPSKLS